MPYVERREFVFHIELSCGFPDDYEGEEDGYAWVEGFTPMAGEMLHALLAVVGRHPGWRVRPGNRGRPTEEEVTLVLERDVSATLRP